MRTSPLNYFPAVMRLKAMSFLVLGLSLSLGVVACDGDDDGGNENADSTTGDGDGDATGDGDGDGDPTGGECITPPEECTRLVSCIGEVLPDQLAAVEAQYGEGGTCWCDGVDAANACYTTCLDQLDAAITAFPTEKACHKSSCELEALDPAEPYGPIVNGACPDWMGYTQTPLQQPFGAPGGVCAPPCLGIAESCPGHSQTVAYGSCQAAGCVPLCYVNSAEIFPSGTQCQCGATCNPLGSNDGEGNPIGICTFQ